MRYRVLFSTGHKLETDFERVGNIEDFGPTYHARWLNATTDKPMTEHTIAVAIGGGQVVAIQDQEPN